jgi:ATP/ADP translocase
LFLFAAISLVFWWAVHYTKWPLLYPLLYIWVGIFGSAGNDAGLDARELRMDHARGKRLFSLLGSGGILGGIFGGFFGNFAVVRFGTESLLLVIGLCLLGCVVLVQMVSRQHARTHSEEDRDHRELAAQQGLLQSFRVIRESGLLQTIAILICLSSIVTTAAGWQLKAIAKMFTSKKTLSPPFSPASAGTPEFWHCWRSCS